MRVEERMSSPAPPWGICDSRYGLTGRYGTMASLPDTRQDSDLLIRTLARWPDTLH